MARGYMGCVAGKSAIGTSGQSGRVLQHGTERRRDLEHGRRRPSVPGILTGSHLPCGGLRTNTDTNGNRNADKYSDGDSDGDTDGYRNAGNGLR
jgi:hypothetical protein